MPTATPTPTPAPTATATALPRPEGHTILSGSVSLEGTGPAAGIEVTFSQEPEVEIIAKGLVVPWALDFAPDGRIFVTERPGRVRTIKDGALLSEPFAVMEDVLVADESGLMGLALHPDFSSNHYVYVYYMHQVAKGKYEGRLVRFTDSDDKGIEQTLIFSGVQGASAHIGGRIKFGPDGKLYITTGEDGRPFWLPDDDLTYLAGMVLRINADGSVPDDNPFPNSPVYTMGHRNPQGLAWHPLTGQLFSTEHGTYKDDEVNILLPGRHYGFPKVIGVNRDPRYADPILTFTPNVAPASAAFYSDGKLPPEWRNNLFITTLSDQVKGHSLHRVVLDPADNQTVQSHEELFKGEFGRLRDVVQGPDGTLYFTTSNAEPRRPRIHADDDRILRMAPTSHLEVVATTTDSEGKFSVSLPPGMYNVIARQERYLQADLRLMVKRDEGDIALSPVTLLAGDIDGDGRVTLTDTQYYIPKGSNERGAELPPGPVVLGGDAPGAFWGRFNPPEQVRVTVDNVERPVGPGALAEGLKVEILTANRAVYTLFDHDFSGPQDWSTKRDLAFWFKGMNSGRPFGVVVRSEDKRTSRYYLLDDSDQWRYVVIGLRSGNSEVRLRRVIRLEFVFDDKETTGTFWMQPWALVTDYDPRIPVPAPGDLDFNGDRLEDRQDLQIVAANNGARRSLWPVSGAVPVANPGQQIYVTRCASCHALPGKPEDSLARLDSMAPLSALSQSETQELMQYLEEQVELSE